MSTDPPFTLIPEPPGYLLEWRGPLLPRRVREAREAIQASAPESDYGYALFDLCAAIEGADDLDDMHEIARELRKLAPRSGFRVAVVGSEGALATWLAQLGALTEFVSDHWPQGLPILQRFEDLDSARAWAHQWVPG